MSETAARRILYSVAIITGFAVGILTCVLLRVFP